MSCCCCCHCHCRCHWWRPMWSPPVYQPIIVQHPVVAPVQRPIISAAGAIQRAQAAIMR